MKTFTILPGNESSINNVKNQPYTTFSLGGKNKKEVLYQLFNDLEHYFKTDSTLYFRSFTQEINEKGNYIMSIRVA